MYVYKCDSEMSGHERGQIRYENIFHQKRDETYYSVYSSIWVHCTGSMARAGERGAIRKVATHSSWVMCSAANTNFTLAV